MPDAPDDRIDGSAAADAIRLAVRLQDSTPVDTTPPDPSLLREAQGEAERAAGADVSLSDVAEAARQVGVSAETLQMALLAVEAGMPVPGPDDGTVIALSRTVSFTLERWQLEQRLAALGLEKVADRDDGRVALLIFRFRASDDWAKARPGVEGAAQRLGWPPLLATLRRGLDGGCELVLRMNVPRETPAAFRKMVRDQVGVAMIVGVFAAVVGSGAAPVVSLVMFVLAVAVVLYNSVGTHLLAAKARAQMEARLRSFMENLE